MIGTVSEQNKIYPRNKRYFSNDKSVLTILYATDRGYSVIDILRAQSILEKPHDGTQDL